MPRASRFGELSKLPSGRYRARYTHVGHRWKAPSTFHSREAAEHWLYEQHRLIELDAWTPPDQQARAGQTKSVTVGEWIRQWLTLKAPAWKPSTLQDYTATINRRILEVPGKAAALRDIPLAQLTRADIAEWFDNIEAQFGHQPYNRMAYKRLKTALQAAVERDYIPANPAQLRMKPPPAKRKELPTTEDMHAILAELSGVHRFIAVLTLFHGMRIGEVLALRRRDVVDDGERIVMQVRGTAYRKPGVGMVRMDAPKTTAGVRDVPVFPRFHDEVRGWLRHVGDAADTPVCAVAGKMMMDTTHRNALGRAKARAGVSADISPHYGRVWLITTLVEAGMTIPAIGEILGQRDLKTITEVYMRTSEARKREVLDAVNGALG